VKKCARCQKEHTSNFQGCEAIKDIRKTIHSREKAEANAAKTRQIARKPSSYSEVAASAASSANTPPTPTINSLIAIIEEQKAAIALLREAVEALSTKIESRRNADDDYPEMEFEDVIANDDTENDETISYSVHPPAPEPAPLSLVNSIGNVLFPQFEAMFRNFMKEARPELNVPQANYTHCDG
jgi:hypothetical protein